MKKRQDRIRFGVSIVFSFVLTLVFFLVFLLLGLNFGVFNDHVILSKVSESNYYNKVYEEVVDQCEEIIVDNDLPTTILNDVITLERVYVSGRNYIENTLQGREKEIQTDRIEKDFEKNLMGYLSEQGIEVTDEVYQGILEMVSLIKVQYQRNIEFKFIYYIAKYRSYIYKSIIWVIPILVVIGVILIFLLIRIFPYIHRGLRFVQYALMAASAITLISTIYLLVFSGYDSLSIEPFFYKYFISSYLKGALMVYLYISAMGILLSVMLLTLIQYLRSNSIKTHEVGRR